MIVQPQTAILMNVFGCETQMNAWFPSFTVFISKNQGLPNCRQIENRMECLCFAATSDSVDFVLVRSLIVVLLLEH